LKKLQDCDYEGDDNDDWEPVWEKLIENGASLVLRADGVVRLSLSRYAANMPYRIDIIIEFLPTLAVNNVTTYYGGTNPGGTVAVVEEKPDGTYVGNYSECSDGVPGYKDNPNNTPYPKKTIVRGVPNQGYKVDREYVKIHNIREEVCDRDDSSCTGRLAEIKDDDTFEVILRTSIANDEEGTNAVVIVTGKVSDGSIIVEITSGPDDLDLPVPLQIDLRFIPDGSGGYDGWGGYGRTDGLDDDADGSGSGFRGAFMPRTGIASIIEMLLFGLLASLAATAAVVFVIKRQNAKEKGLLGKSGKDAREKKTREKAS